MPRGRGAAYVLVMALPLSSRDELPRGAPAGKVGRVAAIVGLAGGVVVVLATLALWLHYGTAVFLETVMAGIAGCL